MATKLFGGVKVGATSVSWDFWLLAADGTPRTGKVAADLTAYYQIQGSALASITLSNLAAVTTSYTSGGVKEKQDGLYRLDVPNAAFASGDSVTVMLKEGTTAYAPVVFTLEAHGIDDVYGLNGSTLTALGDTRIANLDAAITTRLASGSYTAPPSVASVADAVCDEILSTHTTPGSLAVALTPDSPRDSGTAQAGAASSITLKAGSITLDTTKGVYQVILTSGTGSGQRAFVTAWNNSTKVATVDGTWETTPDATTQYLLYFYATDLSLASIAAIRSGLSTFAAGGNVNVVSMAANVLTASALATDAVAEIQSGLATPTNISVVGSVTTKTGFKLASDGLDAIVVESGMNFRQAQSVIVAAASGVISGQEDFAPVIKGAGVGTTRITATTDADGNRIDVTLNLPA